MKLFNQAAQIKELKHKLKSANVQIKILQEDRDSEAQILKMRLELEAKRIVQNVREDRLKEMEYRFLNHIKIQNKSQYGKEEDIYIA